MKTQPDLPAGNSDSFFRQFARTLRKYPVSGFIFIYLLINFALLFLPSDLAINFGYVLTVLIILIFSKILFFTGATDIIIRKRDRKITLPMIMIMFTHFIWMLPLVMPAIIKWLTGELDCSLSYSMNIHPWLSLTAVTVGAVGFIILAVNARNCIMRSGAVTMAVWYVCYKFTMSVIYRIFDPAFLHDKTYTQTFEIIQFFIVFAAWTMIFTGLYRPDKTED